MPAKKKTVTKKSKSVAKKTSSTKETPAAAGKKATKKSARTTNESQNTSATAKGSHTVKRTRTPSVLKGAARKHAPVVFTLEDARELLKKRKPEEEEAAAPRTSRAAKPKEPVAREVPPALDVPSQKSKHGAASLADILGFGGGPAEPRQTATSTQGRDIPKKFRKYHALLLELRAHVQTSLGMHAEDTLKRSQKEDSGDISTSSDAGTDNFDRDFALSVVSSEQEALREIEAAIKRIHNGTYGVCEITGETISAERLEAVPFTRFSLEGQRQYESTARRRIQRGGGSFLSEGGEITFGGDEDGDN